MNQLITWVLYVSLSHGAFPNLNGDMSINMSEKTVSMYYHWDQRERNMLESTFDIKRVEKEGGDILIKCMSRENFGMAYITVSKDYVLLYDMSRMSPYLAEFESVIYYRNHGAIALSEGQIKKITKRSTAILNRQ